MSIIRDKIEDERILPTITSGGTTGEQLTKNSDTGGDIDWGTDELGVESITGTTDEIDVGGTAAAPIISISNNFSRNLTPPSGSVLVTGNLLGLDVDYSSVDTMSISEGTCWDSTNTVQLTLATADTATISLPVADTIYHMFLTDLGDVQFDTNISGSGLSGVTSLRWIGFVVTDGSGDIIPCNIIGDKFEFLDPVYNDKCLVLTTGGANVWSQADISSLAPISRVNTADMVIRSAYSGPVSLWYARVIQAIVEDTQPLSLSYGNGLGYRTLISGISAQHDMYFKCPQTYALVYLSACTLKR